MKIVVIGSGLIGVTTAYFLRRAGHQVTVIERRDEAGRETSFANGALLTPSMSDPWNAPGCWRVLLASLTRADAALQLRVRALPSLGRWGLAFLRNSSPEAFERNTLSNLHLALYSRQVMSSLRQEEQLDYGHTASGTLRVFRSVDALDRAVAAAARLSSEGVRYRKLSASETAELDPALAPIAAQLTGAMHYEVDSTGDAYRFCTSLADRAQARGVEFCFGTEVTGIDMRSGQIAAVVCGPERFVADRYVIAAGSYTTPLLKRLGILLPVRPAKGYSVTFAASSDAPLRIPVIDDDFHAAIVPLGGAIRVAGTAEFCGDDLALNADRIRNLLRLMRNLLPRGSFDLASSKPWCGLRPMSADGVPIIGASRIANLLINTGHGHLGWTMAAGSAHLLADLISQRPTSVDPLPFSPSRFRGVGA